ncbi:glycoside hydrolase family 92 protein, partial [Dysgonomonas sp. OttesenSCG-928-M03]|nr:glycoside hydrolase family 92 protein [Dysgonomonas sp. OttesenSCG-928-M03]
MPIVFYPVCPGTDQYIVGSPLFKKVTLNLENGKEVVITANNMNTDNRYIDAMTINGKSSSRNYITHQDLINGAKINFEMSSAANKK